jgi:macrolide-specific efflux system membrane fusion protein
VQEAKLQGRLSPRDKADLFFRYQGGRLTRLLVKVNDRVKAGQLVAELDVGSMVLQIEQRKILVEKARLTRELLDVRKANKYELALAELDTRLAELQLQELEQSLDKLRLVSPLDGIVTATGAVEGDYIEAFKPVVRVVDPSRLVVECQSDAQGASSFYRGLAVTVSIRANDCAGIVIMTPQDAQQQATIIDGEPRVMAAMGGGSSVGSSSEARIPILIDVKNLPRGAAMNDLGIVTLILARRPKTIVLPRDVVHSYSGRSYVNVLSGNAIEERDVEIGLQLASEVEIVGGLTGGEKVIRR